MGYSVHADVQQAAGGAARLVQLADFDGDGAEDAGVVDAAIAEADALINSYANKRYQVPFVAPSVEIVKLSARMAARILRRDRMQVIASDVTDEATDRAWLSDLSAGKVTAGVEPQPMKSSIQVDTASTRPSSKSVSREKLKGWW